MCLLVEKRRWVRLPGVDVLPSSGSKEIKKMNEKISISARPAGAIQMSRVVDSNQLDRALSIEIAMETSQYYGEICREDKGRYQ